MNKNEKKFGDNEIIKSKISCISKICPLPKKNMTFEKNRITIKKEDNNIFYIYHMYDSKDYKYSGRWYNTEFNMKRKLNIKNKTMNVRMFFEDDNQKYKVDICIYFNDKGFDKIIKML